jgi:hypothetical protein
LVLIATGVWMGFAGSWWGRGWIWASIASLVLLIGLMSYISIPYHRARDSMKEADTVLGERLDRTRPLLATWLGTLGLLGLIFPDGLQAVLVSAPEPFAG